MRDMDKSRRLEVVKEARREYLRAAHHYAMTVDPEEMRILKDGRSWEARDASGEKRGE